jgi:branched-chain amino acid transport system ATP-binding protein
MSPLLEIENLKVSYGTIEVLHGISCCLDAGDIICLLGSNGAGKTTMLKAISGILKIDSGAIRFKGTSIIDVAAPQRVSKGLVHCPEGRGIFPNLSVWENLQLGAYSRKDKHAIQRDIQRGLEWFPILEDRLSQLAGTLSGGEQQMLAMARAVMAHPQLLLLDEPSLGLAPQMIESVFEKIKLINREGVTILLVEQNAQVALEISKFAYVLETGNLILQGPSETLLNDSSIKKAYLGEAILP